MRVMSVDCESGCGLYGQRPHRSNNYMRPVATDGVAWSVCVSVCRSRMKSLPKYVAESPDRMPATRLYDGNLAMLMELWDKMNGRLMEYGSSVAAMFSELLSLKERVKVLSASMPGGGAASCAVGVGISTGYKHKQTQSTTHASGITKLDMDVVHHESWKPIYFGNQYGKPFLKCPRTDVGIGRLKANQQPRLKFHIDAEGGHTCHVIHFKFQGFKHTSGITEARKSQRSKS